MFEERKDKAEEERIGGMDEWEEARTVKYIKERQAWVSREIEAAC